MKVESKDSLGNQVIAFVRKPNAKDNREAKLYSNTVAAKIMSRRDEDGKPTFITRSQIRDILHSSGKLSKEKEERISKLTNEIRELEQKLAAGGIKKSEGKELAILLRRKRNEFIIECLEINEQDEYTLEYQVENSNFDYLVSVCANKEDGSRLFTSIDDYKDKMDKEPYAFDVAKALKNIIYGTDEDIFKDNIENKFLLKYGYINDKLQFIDENGNVVDENGQNYENNDVKPLEVGEFLDE